MRVLVACECSGIVREAFRRRGFDAWSCDLKPAEDGSEHHIEGDVFAYLASLPDGFYDLMIAHPDCTYLTNTGNKWFTPEHLRPPDRHRRRAHAAADFMLLFNTTKAQRVAVENPVGHMGTAFRPADVVVHPYWFGDPARKATGLWLRNLPVLTPTNMVEPIIVTYKNGKGTDNPWHTETMHLPPAERAAARSRTFPGIAEAMADQWGAYLKGAAR
jgi:hypothetical protein